MEINLTVQPSTRMENTENENNIIRIPEIYRNNLNLSVGNNIGFKRKNGTIKNFQISFAYKEDLFNPWTGYITCNNFNSIELTKQTLLTIGCDPEFFLINTKTYKTSNAGNYFPFNGNVGNDGLVGEFRPIYNNNEDYVAENIMYLINKARNKLNTTKDGKDIMLYAASSYNAFAAGYHIHFGLPKSLLIYNSFNCELLKHIVSILDYYVGIMAVLPEGIDDTYRRSNISVPYGKPGAFKFNRKTMEYRTPGAYLLRHPILSKGIMAIGYTVMDDIINNLINNNLLVQNNVQQTIDNLKQVYNTPPATEIYNAICSPYIFEAMNYLSNIQSKLSTMPLYENKKQNIINFFNTVENNIKFTGNIEINWREFYYDKQQEQVDIRNAPVKTSYYTTRGILLEN